MFTFLKTIVKTAITTVISAYVAKKVASVIDGKGITKANRRIR